MKLTTAIATSTIGRPCLKQAIESVVNQTRHARHYIFVDGPKYKDKAMQVIDDCKLDSDTVIVHLPNNTGANMYTCSHINAMASYMIAEDMLLFLDDDNWFEKDHVETLVGMVERYNLDWGASLRNIVDNDGNFICADESESLALVPNRANGYHVDTSCMAVRKEIAQKMAPHWIMQKWMDRTAFKFLVDSKYKGGSTGKFTLNYRLSDDGLGNVTPEIFKQLNDMMLKLNPQAIWRNELIFKFENEV